MGIYVDDANELAEAVVKLRYVDLMGIGSDIFNMVSEMETPPTQPHEWAELFYDWAETKVAIAREEREKRRAEEEKKKQAAAPQPVNQQRGVAR